eukprot:Em0003g129a
MKYPTNRPKKHGYKTDERPKKQERYEASSELRIDLCLCVSAFRISCVCGLRYIQLVLIAVEVVVWLDLGSDYKSRE